MVTRIFGLSQFILYLKKRNQLRKYPITQVKTYDLKILSLTFNEIVNYGYTKYLSIYFLYLKTYILIER